MISLQGQVAVITGASSGIGLAAARELAGAGMKLVLHGRNRGALATLAAELPAAAAVLVTGDVTEPDTAPRLLAAALEAFGRCDAVFNSAGVMEVGGIDDLDLERACRMVRINFEAALRLSYVFLRHFKPAGGGHLVNVSSILGTRVRLGTGAYAGTKFAIEALTDALRLEVAGTPVKVSVLEPGLTESHLQDHFKVHPKTALNMQKLLEPEDVARCLRFMLEQPPHVRIPRLLVIPAEQAM
ncbi:MAG: SDR family oxidoreductase [Lentisphaeria bacterium]